MLDLVVQSPQLVALCLAGLALLLEGLLEDRISNSVYIASVDLLLQATAATVVRVRMLLRSVSLTLLYSLLQNQLRLKQVLFDQLLLFVLIEMLVLEVPLYLLFIIIKCYCYCYLKFIYYYLLYIFFI